MEKQVENKYGIIPFNGTGFDNWKFRLSSVLKAMECSEVLSNVESSRDELWRKKNYKACMIIIQSVADSHLEYIKEVDVAYEMMKKLEGIFDKKGTCSKFYLLKELTSLKYNCDSNIHDHFAKCDRLFRELKNLGSNFDESDISCFLLLSMPKEFESVVTAIRTLSEDDLKMEFVKSRLLEFNSNKISSNRNIVPSSFSASNKQLQCFKCGKLGHLKNVCGIKCFKCNRFGHRSQQCLFRKNNSNANQTDGNRGR